MPINAVFLDNPKSERVRRIAELTNRKARARSGRFIIEGPQSVREAVRYASDVVCDLYVVSDVPRQNQASISNADVDTIVPQVLAPIVVQALEHGIYVHMCSSAVIERMSHDSQGIVAVGDTSTMRDRFGSMNGSDDLNAMDDVSGVKIVNSVGTVGSADFEDAAGSVESAGSIDAVDSAGSVGVTSADGFAHGLAQGSSLFAAFWQVRDPGNAGTVIRAADAAGCRAVILVDDCVDTLNPKVIRATVGSLFHLPVLTMSTDEFFSWCLEYGVEIIAADVHGTNQQRPELLPKVLINNSGVAGGAGAVEETSSSGTVNNPSSTGIGHGVVACDSGVKGGGNTALTTMRVVLFGNEARGLPDVILTQANRIVAIPIYGKAESLNLGTSAAVMLMCFAMVARS